jgi:hypothetical protein
MCEHSIPRKEAAMTFCGQEFKRGAILEVHFKSGEKLVCFADKVEGNCLHYYESGPGGAETSNCHLIHCDEVARVAVLQRD